MQKLGRDRSAYYREYQKRRYWKAKFGTDMTEAELAEYRANQEVIYTGPEPEIMEVRQKFKEACLAWNETQQDQAPPNYDQIFFNVLYAPKTSQDSAWVTRWKAEALSKAKVRAVELAVEFSLLPSHIDIPQLCPVLHTPLKGGGLVVLKTDDSATPSLDRVDSKLGYTPDNIVVMSWKANRLKNNATLAELMALGRWAALLGVSV